MADPNSARGRQDAKRRVARRLVAVHLAVRAPGQTIFSSVSPVYCGAERTGETKVAAARGVATCHACIERYDAGKERLRQLGRRMFRAAFRF